MGCSLFSNSHLQMGVTIMGFAEHFGLSYSKSNGQSDLWASEKKRTFKGRMNVKQGKNFI